MGDLNQIRSYDVSNTPAENRSYGVLIFKIFF